MKGKHIHVNVSDETYERIIKYNEKSGYDFPVLFRVLIMKLLNEEDEKEKNKAFQKELLLLKSAREEAQKEKNKIEETKLI